MLCMFTHPWLNVCCEGDGRNYRIVDMYSNTVVNIIEKLWACQYFGRPLRFFYADLVV